jgi:hypothetical protein
MNQECLPAANIRRSGRMAGRLNVTFCGWCGSWLTRAGLLFWSPARLLVTAPCAGPGRVYLWPALRGGCWWPPAGSGRAWRYGAGLLVPGSARSRYCTEIRPGGAVLGLGPFGCAGPPGRFQEGPYQGCSAIGRLTQATAGHAEPGPGCYVLRGWRVSPQGTHPGGVGRREARPCRMWRSSARTTRTGASTPSGLVRGADQTGAGCGHRGRVSRSARGPRRPWPAVSPKKTAG